MQALGYSRIEKVLLFERKLKVDGLYDKFTKIIKDEYEHHEFGKIEIKDIPRVKRLSGPHLVRSWTEIPHVTHHD